MKDLVEAQKSLGKMVVYIDGRGDSELGKLKSINVRFAFVKFPSSVIVQACDPNTIRLATADEITTATVIGAGDV